MGKSSLGSSIFRVFIGLGTLGFMAMLYWSSALLEEHVIDIKAELATIEKQVGDLRRESSQVRSELRQKLKTLHNKRLHGDFSEVEMSNPQSDTDQVSRPHIDPESPNLLSEDPFYQNVLPKLLPPDFTPSGTRRMAIVGKPDTLHPFSNWSHVSSWVSQCNVSVAQMHFGRYETMGPDMALKLELRTDSEGRPEFWVHLRDGVYWQPLDPELLSEDVELAPHFLQSHQVTADDFKFYLDALMNPWVQEAGAVSLRNYLGDIEELRVIDKLTFVVRWKTEQLVNNDGSVEHKMKYIARSWTGNLSPLASWVYQYFPDGSKIIEDSATPIDYRTDSVWAQNFNKHWAKNIIPSCGPWVFTGMSDRQITFKRNPDYYKPLAVLVEATETQFKETPDAIWQDFKSGKLDTYQVRPDQLLELEDFLESDVYKKQAANNLAIHRLDYLGRSYSYLGWNQARPYFSDAKVRRALTMAISRNRIIEQTLNDMGVEITGPFHVLSPSYDPSIKPWPHDPRLAQRLLSRNGWYDSDGDGVLDKDVDGDRVPFSFTLTYYVKSPTAKAIGEYVRLALKEVDIDVDLNGVDIADLSENFDDKSFDAILLGWSQGSPPEEPRQLWHSSGAQQKGSSNAIGFSNAEVDSIIDNLAYEYDPQNRRKLYHRFDHIIHEEAPYTFMYAPKEVFLYRDYVQNVFIPSERQDLVPGADVSQPQGSVFWLRSEA